MLDLERITSTSGERALEAKTWKLSVQDVLEEHSGLQELPWKGTKEIGGRGQSTGGTGAVLCLRVTAFILLTARTGK